MIEINLVPDVKQELIRAQRTRASVVTIAIITSLIAVAVVIVLALYIGSQSVRGLVADNSIKENSEKLAAVADLSNSLTIQNQLDKLGTLHETKKIDSRLIDVIAAVNPPKPNDVGISNLTLVNDDTTKLISIEAQAVEGYKAAEIFRKTIEEAKVEYTVKDEEGTKSVALAKNVSISDTSYGEDASNRKVLRFKLSFEYDDAVFSRASQNARVIVPSKLNVTDSFVRVPQSLFTSPARDLREGN